MTSPQMAHWVGRDDIAEEGASALRWHQVVKAWMPQAPPGYALLGFACDEGVARNQGRVGAAQAPIALRQVLSNLAWHHTFPLYDAGDVTCADGDLDKAHWQLGKQVASLLEAGQHPIIIGGGHETAWGTFLGLVTKSTNQRLGIINLDAHFDLRQSDRAHSGTPFAQMANWRISHQQPFHYLCLGVAEATNTAALFQRASSLGVQWIIDEELSPGRYSEALSKIKGFIDKVDRLYLSIDLDVLPISIMKAVSAPSALGVPLEVVLSLIKLIADTGKLRVVDIVEYNPLLDDQQACARVAARIIWHVIKHWLPRDPS